MTDVENPIANTTATAKPMPRPATFRMFLSPSLVLLSFE